MLLQLSRKQNDENPQLGSKQRYHYHDLKFSTIAILPSRHALKSQRQLKGKTNRGPRDRERGCIYATTEKDRINYRNINSASTLETVGERSQYSR